MDVSDSKEHVHHCPICVKLDLNASGPGNEFSHTQTIEEYSCNGHKDMNQYIKSNDKAHLLIQVKFTQEIALQSMRIHILNENMAVFSKGIRLKLKDKYQTNVSAPHTIEIFKIIDMNAEIQSIQPDTSVVFTPTSENAIAGQKIDLQCNSNLSSTFRKTNCIAIYFPANKLNTPKTLLNAITFYGFAAVSVKQHTEFSTNIPEIEKVDYKMNSQYLFENKSIHGKRQNEYNKKCVLPQCAALKRVVSALKSHDKYLNMAQESLSSHMHKSDETKNRDVELLNSFNHLLFHHEESHDFEYIYKTVMSAVNNDKICQLSNCVMMRRNHRDRSRSLCNKLLFKKLYYDTDTKTIVRQQLLDRIHCHYLHSFDIGYRLTELERRNISNEDIKTDNETQSTFDGNVMKIYQIINKKSNVVKNVQGLERLTNTSNKFVTDMKNNESNMYSFGYRYFYWDYYKENTSEYDDAQITESQTEIFCETRPKANDDVPVGYWYIPKKFKNLKHELLANAIYTITALQWKNLSTKAEIYMSIDNCKHMKCVRKVSAKCYGMKQMDPVTISHLISMMVYCNNDVMQSKFTETFRRLHKSETNAALIKRHQNFYHLGKLLRECVECFGTSGSFMEEERSINLYHGLDKTFTFAAVSAYIKGPFSTTTDYVVACNFCGNKGTILNLYFSSIEFVIEADAAYSCSSFDCKWISDYSNEQEVFFIGGLHRFQFKTIIDATISSNYQWYIRALRQLNNCASIDGNHEDIWLEDPTDLDSQMLFRLLSHEIYKCRPMHRYATQFKTCPQYIEEILHSHCMAIKQILFENDKSNQRIFEHLFKDENGWFDIDLITNVFPNVEGIRFDASCSDCMEDIMRSSIYDSTLLFLRNNYKTSNLEFIIFQVDLLFVSEIGDFIKKYESKFGIYEWKIHVVMHDTEAYTCMSTIQYSLLVENCGDESDDEYDDESDDDEYDDESDDEYETDHDNDT